MLRILASTVVFATVDGMQVLSSVRKSKQEPVAAVSLDSFDSDTDQVEAADPLFDPDVTAIDQMLTGDPAASATNPYEDTIGAMPEASAIDLPPYQDTVVSSEAPVAPAAPVAPVAPVAAQPVAPAAPVAAAAPALAVSTSPVVAASALSTPPATASVVPLALQEAMAAADAAALQAQQIQAQAVSTPPVVAASALSTPPVVATSAVSAPPVVVTPVTAIVAPLALQDAIAAADAARLEAQQMHDQAVAEAEARAEALAQAAARAEAAAAEAKQLREQAVEEASEQAEAASAQANELRAQLAAAEQEKAEAEQLKAAIEGTKTASEQEGGATVAVAQPVAAAISTPVASAIASPLPTQALSAQHVAASILVGTVPEVPPPVAEFADDAVPQAAVPEVSEDVLPAYDLSQDVPVEVRNMSTVAKAVVADVVPEPSAINAKTGEALPPYNLNGATELASTQAVAPVVGETVDALPAYNLSQDAATPATTLNTIVAIQALGNKEEHNCSNIEGGYATAQGEAVTVFQTGCFLTVKAGSVVRSGQITALDLVVEGLEQAGSGRVSDVGDVFFANGDRWMKTKV